jgi:acyl-CoA thioester hydrolase
MSRTDIKRSDFRCWIKIEVRWGDMDAIGHVNNGKYFTYCESGRIFYFQQLNMGGLTESSHGPALANASLNFRRQVRYPASLEVGVRVSEVRSRSFQMDYGIFLDGTETLVADGTSVIVWADYKAGKSLELPVEIKETIEKIEGRK